MDGDDRAALSAVLTDWLLMKLPVCMTQLGVATCFRGCATRRLARRKASLSHYECSITICMRICYYTRRTVSIKRCYFQQPSAAHVERCESCRPFRNVVTSDNRDRTLLNSAFLCLSQDRRRHTTPAF